MTGNDLVRGRSDSGIPRTAWVRGRRGAREAGEQPERRRELGGRGTGSGRGLREKGDRGQPGSG